MLCSSESLQKQIDRATCLNKLQAPGLCFCENLGNWVAVVRSTHSSAQPHVSPRSAVPSLCCCVVQSAGAVEHWPEVRDKLLLL